MKVLITGGSGFIGTNLIELFRTQLCRDLLNVDIAAPRCEAHNRYWANVDITDYPSFHKVVLDFCPDYIVHLAARTDINGRNVGEYNANTTGVENVVKVANDLPHLKKIIFTSSMLVSRVGYKMAHICDYCPPNAYGESKVITERIVRDSTINADWSIIRPTSIWGEWFDTYRNFFEMVMAGRYVHFGKKSSTKTYGYVGNAVYQVEQLLFTNTFGRSFESRIYYIGDKPAYNIEDWANEIARLSGKQIKRVPLVLIKCAALFGDVLKVFKLTFPMTSFRLRNMTTDNIIDVEPIMEVAPNPPFLREEASSRTILWIKNNRRK